MQPGQRPQWRPLKRQESDAAQQMVERAAELARDSHARTRHAAVLVRGGSLLAWGTNGVPFPGEDHCYCKFATFGHHDNCRTHAEQRAVTLAREGDGWRMLQGAKLIYVRLEADDSVRLEEPHFCARCSRLALSMGVEEWIFALADGLVGYSAADYDGIAQLRWLSGDRARPPTRGGRARGAEHGRRTPAKVIDVTSTPFEACRMPRIGAQIPTADGHSNAALHGPGDYPGGRARAVEPRPK